MEHIYAADPHGAPVETVCAQTGKRVDRSGGGGVARDVRNKFPMADRNRDCGITQSWYDYFIP
jgi:hypothetical protein